MNWRGGLVGVMLLADAMQVVAADGAMPPKYPVEAFAQLPAVDDARISPDGTAVAARLAVNGVQGLGIIPLGDASAKPVLVGLGKMDLGWFDWAGNDRLLVSIGTIAEFRESQFPATRLVSVPRTGGQETQLNWQEGAQFGDRAIWTPPGGGSSLLMSTTTTIYANLPGFWPRIDRVDAATGQTETILKAQSGIRRWYADRDGIVRMGVGYDSASNKGRIIYRANASDAFRTIDTARYSRDEDLLVPVRFSPDPTRLVVLSEHDGRYGLYEYDVTADRIGTKLFGDTRYDAGAVIESPDRSTIAGIRFVDDRMRTVWFDPVMKQLQADLDSAVPGHDANICCMSADGNRMVVRISSPTVPPVWMVMDRTTGRMTKFGASNEALKGAILSPMTAVTYKARDGLDIPAYLTLPAGRDPKNLPLIVLPHGGPQSRDFLRYDYQVQFLANRGYAVLQPNYRGSAGYGTEFREKGEGQWGLAMQDDLTDGVRWAAAQGIADPKRVCIAGGSYGGYAALQGAVREPDLFRCAISFAGVSDLGVQLRYDSRYLGAKRRRADLKKAAPDFALVSPLRHAESIKAPVLLIHGKADLVVPYTQSEKMDAALVNAGKTVEFVTQPLGDHHLTRQADRIELLTRMEAFLAKYNPAD